MQTAPIHSKETDFVFQRRNRLKDHFVTTSKVLLYGYQTLSDGAKITYQVIDGFDWEDKETRDSKGFVYPCAETLATIRGITTRTIERHIAELEEVQLLTRQQRRNQPSILIIEDVSQEESKLYLAKLHTSKNVSAPTTKQLQLDQVKCKPRHHVVSSANTKPRTTIMTNDKNVVRSEPPRTTKMSFAYSEITRNEEEQQQVVATLQEFKIGEYKAQQLALGYTADYLVQKIALLKSKLDGTTRGQPIIDAAAWLVRAIEHNYTPPASLQSDQHKPRKLVLDINERDGIFIIQDMLGEVTTVPGMTKETTKWVE